ncbi:MAG: DUF3048 domain-containing protein [Patescibacteria group bacterium]
MSKKNTPSKSKEAAKKRTSPKKPMARVLARLRTLQSNKLFKPIAGAMLGLIILVVGIIVLNNPEKIDNSPKIEDLGTQTSSDASGDEQVTSPLSGLLVPASSAANPVTGLIIDNTPSVRPQSGLSDAEVVIESISEAGGTKLLAIFQTNTPDKVGPIRSSRPHLIEWLEPFDAVHGHVGADNAGRAALATYVDQSMDQYEIGGPVYERISSVPAPHNVFTGFDQILKYTEQQGYDSDNLQSFERKPSEPAVEPTATQIDMRISSNIYNPSYSYDSDSNSYFRSFGQVAHRDANTDEQLAADVVIGMIVSGSSFVDDGPRYRYNNIGSGVAYIFQDGEATKGRWNKSSVAEQITFSTESGESIKLNPGVVWISMVNGVDWQ